MAISLLQDAQTRSIAAALAGIKCDDVDRSLSMSPPMSANNSSSSLYPSLQHAAAASAFGMLSPSQLLAANRQAAAAFMAAQLPMSTLASTLFPHHPAALFGSWGPAPTTPHMPLASAPHSPPVSPHSPLSGSTTPASSTKHMISPSANSHQLELPAKKPRKLSIKKDLVSSPIEISMSVSDMYHSPSGPISPPSSGSSPTSTHDGPSVSSGGSGHKDPSRDKSFTCKICSRSFGYKHVLQNHERTHTGEKPFECPECHKRFTRDHHLKTHMRLHTGEKPYHCSHCDRQFVQVANLRRHLRVHTGERPYTCEICEGKFSDSNQLKSHMLVHNGEKPFECERCHMKFRRRHHLMNHKCGIQSPPTPAISPAMSGEFPLCDKTSAMGSSYSSEESMEIGKVGLMSSSSYETEPIEMDESPLDLSEDCGSSVDGNTSGYLGSGGRSRKANDIRRVFRLPQQIMHIPMPDMPEQTEPEDLSMHNPRAALLSQHLRQTTPDSPSAADDDSMMHEDDIDLDDLDDAAALYLRQQHHQQHQQFTAMKLSMQMD